MLSVIRYIVVTLKDGTTHSFPVEDVELVEKITGELLWKDTLNNGACSLTPAVGEGGPGESPPQPSPAAHPAQTRLSDHVTITGEEREVWSDQRKLLEGGIITQLEGGFLGCRVLKHIKGTQYLISLNSNQISGIEAKGEPARYAHHKKQSLTGEPTDGELAAGWSKWEQREVNDPDEDIPPRLCSRCGASRRRCLRALGFRCHTCVKTRKPLSTKDGEAMLKAVQTERGGGYRPPGGA